MWPLFFGCTQNFISNIESGVKAIPSDKVAILQERFGDIADYFTDELPTPTKRERIIANATAGESMSQEGLMNLIRRLLRGVGDECCGVQDEQLEREIAEETGRVQSLLETSAVLHVSAFPCPLGELCLEYIQRRNGVRYLKRFEDVLHYALQGGELPVDVGG